MENIKNTGERIKAWGPTPCPRGWGRALPPGHAPLSRGPPDAPPTSTPTPYIRVRGEKNSERKIHRVLRYGAAAKP